MWFEDLVGFQEDQPDQVRSKLIIDEEHLISKINGRTFRHGILEIPTLQELKEEIPLENTKGTLSIEEIVGNVKELHELPMNEGACFQAASQFNLLEMVGPEVTPEQGVGIYENDYTQGPACAIACGAGTIYRNYFVALGTQIGQSKDRQVDCLEEIGIALGNSDSRLWKMVNGYALAEEQGLVEIQKRIDELDANEYEKLKNKLKIGIQWNTEVTTIPAEQLVTQVYCSALPIAYSNVALNYWESFAKLVLHATYEATFYVALKNYQINGNKKLYLTLVGGGVFGNEEDWIFEAIESAIRKFNHTPLEIAIVSYGQSNPMVAAFIEKLKD